jgi:hypothetical protein
MPELTTAGFDGRVQVRLDDATAAWLASRAERAATGSPHRQARAELALLDMLLAAELRGLRLTLPEARCVADVVAGSLLQTSVMRPGRVYAECFDAFRIARDRDPAGISSYGEKHGIDEGRLLTYLGGLGPAADHALADAVSRWWAGDCDDTPEGFAAVGLQVAAGPASADETSARGARG